MAQSRKKSTRKAHVEDTPLFFESPESAIIEGASYDPGQQVLRVALKIGGDKVARFRYGSVPVRVWEDFYHAPSKGNFFSKVIKTEFSGVAD